VCRTKDLFLPTLFITARSFGLEGSALRGRYCNVPLLPVPFPPLPHFPTAFRTSSEPPAPLPNLPNPFRPLPCLPPTSIASHPLLDNFHWFHWLPPAPARFRSEPRSNSNVPRSNGPKFPRSVSAQKASHCPIVPRHIIPCYHCLHCPIPVPL
jgi:hypothetical protein